MGMVKIRFRVRWASALFLAFGIGCGACNQGSPASVVVGPAGGTVASGHARVTIPAGALGTSVTLGITVSQAPTPLPAGVESVSSTYALTPHGQSFGSPVTVALPYTGSGAGMKVLRLDDPSDTSWEPVAGAQLAEGVATFTTDQFSFYIVTRDVLVHAAVIDTIAIPNAQPRGLLVGGNHDVVVFDADITGDDRPQLRFLEVSHDAQRDTYSVAVAPETVDVLWTTGIRQSWMAYDRHHQLAYVLARRDRTTTGGIRWDEMRVHVISGRGQAGFFVYNPGGGDPAAAPTDFRYEVGGFALKEASTEGNNPTRLVVDDTVGGNLDVLELDASGTALATQWRHSYRDRWETGCTWPPAPAPWTCHWPGNQGNTLALEARHETQSPGGALETRDLLYVADHLSSETRVRVLSMLQAGATLDVQALADIDLAPAHQIFANGLEGLTLAAAKDTLYLSSGLQSFAEGYLGTIDTVTQSPGVILLPFADREAMAVDSARPERVFVATTDRFTDGAPLILRVLEDGELLGSVQVLDHDPGTKVDSMAYDPAYGLLYLAAGNQIVVVRVD